MHIRLTQSKTAVIDDEDYSLIKSYKWYAVFMGGGWYAASKLKGKVVYMHRIILGVNDPNIFVDHWNGDSLNCRRSNLRVCNIGQNVRNQKIRSTNTSGYKGVTFFTYQDKYAAQLYFERKRIFLGYFDDPIEAAKAYDKAALKYHGEFARLNFPVEHGS